MPLVSLLYRFFPLFLLAMKCAKHPHPKCTALCVSAHHRITQIRVETLPSAATVAGSPVSAGHSGVTARNSVSLSFMHSITQGTSYLASLLGQPVLQQRSLGHRYAALSVAD